MQGFITAAMIMVILYLALIISSGDIDNMLTKYEQRLDPSEFTQFNNRPSRYSNNWNNTETIDQCGAVSEGECVVILNQIEVLPQLIPVPTSEFTESYK